MEETASLCVAVSETLQKSRKKLGAAEVSVPVLGVVAGLLWGQWAGQSGHLDPDGVVQILLTGVDCAGDYKGHAEKTGPVLLR